MHNNPVNLEFWQAPPWQEGVARQRMGLQPVSTAAWLNPNLDQAVMANKRQRLAECYADVVAAAPDTGAAQSLLMDLPMRQPLQRRYPHLIADVALTVAEDLCLLDVEDEQRLVAACVCAPSYWRLQDKMGQPLLRIHAPVPGLNAKIGGNIQRFLFNMPLGQPFARSNWFLHGDDELFHTAAEAGLDTPPPQWIVRSERQTLCKLSARYVLFTIEIICEPLVHIGSFPRACADLRRALQRMDAGEVEHFGGVEKQRSLTEYVASFAGGTGA